MCWIDGLAFEALGIPVYAPRAGRFLEVEEAISLMESCFIFTEDQAWPVKQAMAYKISEPGSFVQ